jgi:hypothetical protein
MKYEKANFAKLFCKVRGKEGNTYNIEVIEEINSKINRLSGK